MKSVFAFIFFLLGFASNAMAGSDDYRVKLATEPAPLTQQEVYWVTGNTATDPNRFAVVACPNDGHSYDTRNRPKEINRGGRTLKFEREVGGSPKVVIYSQRSTETTFWFVMKFTRAGFSHDMQCFQAQKE